MGSGGAIADSSIDKSSGFPQDSGPEFLGLGRNLIEFGWKMQPEWIQDQFYAVFQDGLPQENKTNHSTLIPKFSQQVQE